MSSERTITIYEHGIYRHRSAGVAVQGIGRDRITLLPAVAVPGAALMRARRRSPRGRFLPAGVLGILGYFLVTCLSFLVMGVNDVLFLLYTLLLGSSFFAFALACAGSVREDLTVLLARTRRTRLATGVVFAIFVMMHLLGSGADQIAHAGGLRETRRTVDAIEIGEIDLATIPSGSYKGSFVAPLVQAMVEVAIVEGEIRSIKVLEHTHGPGYGAEAIVDSVLEAQSLQVDVVSGATGSSKAMLKAIENALQDR